MGGRGQSLVEFALILPVMMFTMLGFIEAGILLATQSTQMRATETVAAYAAAHHGDPSWSSVAAQVGLGECDVEVTDEPHDIVKVGVTCHYDPRATHGLWDGLPISTETYAALPPVVGGGTPAPVVSLTP